MPSASRFFTVMLLGVFAVALAPGQEKPPAKAPTKEQIKAWIKQLGDDEFDKREEASKKLEEAGEAAEADLTEAAKSPDAEISGRAKAILEKFKYGIYPDTPKKIVDLVKDYQTADPNTRMNIVKELFGSGTAGCRVLMKLVKAEENAEAKANIMNVLSREMSHAAPGLLADANYEMLEMFLDIGLAADVRSNVSGYTSYYLLRDKLGDAVEKVNKKPEFAKQREEILAYLYRAKGDLKAARAAAEKSGQAELTDELLYESGEWKELAKRFKLEASAKDVEKLGYGAAYHRLAGNKKEFDDTVAAIVKYASDAQANDKPSAAFYAAKALFLNDRPEEAIKVLKAGGRPDMAFEILCVQLRFGEAFELLEKARKDGGDMAPQVEILAARTLYGLGEKDKARPMFAKLAEQLKAGKDQSWFEELIDAEARVGLRDEAFEHTGQLLDAFKDAGWSSRLFPKLFPGRGEAAEIWFTHLRAAEPNTASSAHLKQIRTLLEGKTPAEDVVKLLAAAETTARTKQADEIDRWIAALADTALLYKKEDVATAMLEKTKSAAALQRLGDMQAEKKQWDKAAEQYKAAWEKDKHQALALYLYGEALAKGGKAAEGKKHMDLSHWMPLGDETARHAFATALLMRNQNEAARRETDLLVRTSQPVSYYSGEAVRRSALDALAKKDYMKAADGHEKAMLRCLRTYISFLQKGAYVGVPTHVHRLRARGYLEAGKLDEAKKEIEAAQAMLPGDVDLAILVVPELAKRGQEKEAQDIFDKTIAVYEKLCKEYPNCAWAHNSAAWLSVACRRNLEAAKEHALKATNLAPMNAGHLDTLAEAYFQLGDKDKAIATQKRAIDLDPKKAYFRKQLKRIEAGDPKAERPSETDDD
jgi:tetratricopeptide (TPR) repeat protein